MVAVTDPFAGAKLVVPAKLYAIVYGEPLTPSIAVVKDEEKAPVVALIAAF